jgi:3'(2'), 5'-bisphosphate nucleotidase
VSEEPDARLAARVAGAAGELLLEVRTTAGLSPRELGAKGDREANALILRELAAARPGDAVLSEESADTEDRLSADRVWIIDPLDGTREFSMPGRTDWAVHVALWEAGRGVTAAAVAEPAVGLVSASDEVRGSAPVGPARRARPLIVLSESRPPAFADLVAEAVGGETTQLGSAGAKAMAVLRGDADAYLHAGGQWEWDSAAPVGVVTAAGLHASRIDGTSIEYNQPRPYLPDLLICRADLAVRLLGAIAAVIGG